MISENAVTFHKISSDILYYGVISTGSVYGNGEALVCVMCDDQVHDLNMYGIWEAFQKYLSALKS